MSSRHRFLQRSITQVSFHNRLTEEDVMWRRREQERRDRSRSPYEKQKRSSRSSNNESQKKDDDIQIEAEFGPPLPSNLGINADRWDHAFFMQRYPNEYDKQMQKSQRKQSTSSEDKKKKKKHHRHKRREEENKKKTKRKPRSKS